MTRTTLDVSLKGERSYIQGPDMLNAVMEVLGRRHLFQVHGIDFTMHHMTSRQLLLDVCETRGAREGKEAAVMKLVGAEDQTLWAVLQESDQAPTKRVQDKEKSIFALCEIDTAERAVKLKAASELSWAEVVVAMTKLLHNTLCPLTPTQQWVVCRLVCPNWTACQSAPTGLRIKIDRILGTKLTRSSVWRQEEFVADMFFAVRERT